MNDVPLVVRSEEETFTLQKIDDAIIKYLDRLELKYNQATKVLNEQQVTSLGDAKKLGLPYDIAFLLDMIIRFVKSDLYVEVAEKFSGYKP